jgi:hypothetical protein
LALHHAIASCACVDLNSCAWAFGNNDAETIQKAVGCVDSGSIRGFLVKGDVVQVVQQRRNFAFPELDGQPIDHVDDAEVQHQLHRCYIWVRIASSCSSFERVATIRDDLQGEFLLHVGQPLFLLGDTVTLTPLIEQPALR